MYLLLLQPCPVLLMLKPPCVEAFTQERHTHKTKNCLSATCVEPVQQHPAISSNIQQYPAHFNVNQFNPIQTWLRLSFLNFIPIGVVTLGCNLVYQSHARASSTDSRHIHSTLCGFATPFAIYDSLLGYGRSSAKGDFS